MEKKKTRPSVFVRRGVMEARLRRRDPAGDAPFDPEEEEGDEDVENRR